jgi:P pilus assembly chaperone PapD
MKGKLSLAVVVCLFLVGVLRAQDSIKIVDSKTQVILEEKAARISIRVKNSQNDFDGVIFFELLDVKGPSARPPRSGCE